MEQAALLRYVFGNGGSVHLPDSYVRTADAFVKQYRNGSYSVLGPVVASEAGDPFFSYRQQVYAGGYADTGKSLGGATDNQLDGLLGTFTGLFSSNGDLIGLTDTFDYNPGGRDPLMEFTLAELKSDFTTYCGSAPHAFAITAGQIQ